MIRLFLVCLCVATWQTADCQTSTLNIIKQSPNQMTAEICIHHSYTIDCGWDMKLEFSGPIRYFNMKGTISKTRGGLLKSEKQPFVIVSNLEWNKIQTHKACHQFDAHFTSPVKANATYSRICNKGKWTDLLKSNGSYDCINSTPDELGSWTSKPGNANNSSLTNGTGSQKCNPSTCPREQLFLTPLRYWNEGIAGQICISRGNPVTCIFDIGLIFSSVIKSLEVDGMRIVDASRIGLQDSYLLTLERKDSVRANKTQCYSIRTNVYLKPRSEKINVTARYSDTCHPSYVTIPETTTASTRTWTRRTTTRQTVKSTDKTPTDNLHLNCISDSSFLIKKQASWNTGLFGYICVHPNFPLTCRNVVELSFSPPVLSLETQLVMTTLREIHTDEKSLFTLRSGIEGRSSTGDSRCFWFLVRHNDRKELTNVTCVNVSEYNDTTSEMMTQTTSTTPPTTVSSSTTPQTTRTPFPDYKDSLNKSMIFYLNQRALKISDNPLRRLYPEILDTYNGRNLSGGLFDSADYVKFNFPMAATTTTLLWGFLQWKDAYNVTGQLDAMYELMTHSLDYLMRCWDNDTQVLITQIGMRNEPAPSWSQLLTVSRPGTVQYTNASIRRASDLAGEMAAAMAAGSLVFRAKDPTFADQLLTTAKQVYTFANETHGVYSDQNFQRTKYYSSTDYRDELCWGAAWLLRATGNEAYLSQVQNVEKLLTPRNVYSWDNKVLGCYLLMHSYSKTEVDKKHYREKVESFLDDTTTTRTTNCGLTFYSAFRPLKGAANTAMIALMAAASGIKPELYITMAEKQIKYMLGANKHRFSYQVGFGENYPEEPYYLGVSSPDQSIPRKISYTGALVNGPNKDNDFYGVNDGNATFEVSIDLNAGFQSSLAGLIHFQQMKQLPNVTLPCEARGNQKLTRHAATTL